MMLDPFGIFIAIANRNLGLNVACIWFKPVQHFNVVPLVLKVNSELANLVAEAVAVLSEFGDGDTMEDFSVVDGGDEATGNGMDNVIEVLLGCQCCEGCLG